MPRSRQQLTRTESDSEMLVRRMAAGDHAAMAELYDETSALVFGLALRIVAEHSAAQDILVEVYAQAWKRAAEFDAARGSALTWLLTMTRSRAIDWRRARRRERATEPLEAASEVCCGRPGPEAISAAAERQRCIRRTSASTDAQHHPKPAPGRILDATSGLRVARNG